MRLNFRATTKNDLEAISAFLQRVFGVGPQAPFLNPALMCWKYWDRRADCTEPRSYVLEDGASIIAHAGIVPMTVGSEAHAALGVEMIDWAAAKESPGAGIAILRKLATKFDFVYSIGGTEMTRKVLPLYGFVEHAQTWRAARPLRPFSQILKHQYRNYKLAPRLARNWLWATRPRHQSTSQWAAREIVASQIDDSLFAAQAGSVYSSRTSAFFEYYLACPLVKFRLYEVRNQNQCKGYFIVGVVQNQARIAGIWLREPGPVPWRAVYGLAQQVARTQTDAHEVAASGTLGPSGDAAIACGLHRIGIVPVYLLNKKRKIDLPKDFQFQLWDNDEAFLDHGQPEYWT